MASTDAAGVIASPPVLLLATWTVAQILDRIAGLELARDARRARRVVGGTLIGAGVCLSAMVVRHFAQASTPVSPLRPSRALVTDGPYRYSRNPDYVGQLLVYTGVSIFRNRWWPLLLLPACLGLITHGVIEREERYLARRFGAAYRGYAARVPRWV
jgi:protein-S-isoprenylcysteine O-methyltransferase Ste14